MRMRKVLFICQGNMFRSQTAEALYGELGTGDEVKSAGIWVVKEHHVGVKIKEFEGFEEYIDYMKTLGHDMSNYVCKPITKELVDWADKVIVMADEEIWPDYLFNSPKVTHWEVENPDIVTRAKTEAVANQLKQLIQTV